MYAQFQCGSHEFNVMRQDTGSKNPVNQAFQAGRECSLSSNSPNYMLP